MARISKDYLYYSFEGISSLIEDAKKHMDYGKEKDNWLEYYYCKGQYEALQKALKCFVELAAEYERLKEIIENGLPF